MSKIEPYNSPEKGNEDPDLQEANEKMDKTNLQALENGPVMQRSCTDCWCCLVFVAFLVLLAMIVSYGFLNGEPELLLTPWDYDGRGCGYSEDKGVGDLEYLYWPLTYEMLDSDVLNVKDLIGRGMCVDKCPTESNTFDCKVITIYEDDMYDTGCRFKDEDEEIYYNTKLYVGRFCMPDLDNMSDSLKEEFEDLKDRFYQEYGGETLTLYISDLFTVWYVLCMCIGAAFIFGLLYMLALRCLAGCVIWFSIVAIFVITAAAGYAVYYYKDDYYEPEDDYYKYANYTAYGIWGCAALFLLVIICMCSRIRLGIAIYKTTALFMRQNCSVFLIPFVFLLIIAVWVAFWCVGAIYLFSIGDLQPRTDVTVVSTVEWTKETRYFFLYNFFALLWVNAFFIGLAQFTIAAACAMWYFTWQGDVPGTGSVLKGLRWGLTKHLGSIAFGSCIIAIVQFIRYIFEYYRKKAKKGTNNRIMKAIFCVTSYCLMCLEKCVKFISKNAYIQIALTSNNFCASAWQAFCLILKNAGRFAVVGSMGCIFLFLGKLFIACATAVACYAALTYWDKPADEIASPYLPCFVALIIGYVIGSIYLSVFSFSADTILQCFLVDEELAAKGTKRPESNRPPTMTDFVTDISKDGKKKGCCC